MLPSFRPIAEIFNCFCPVGHQVSGFAAIPISTRATPGSAACRTPNSPGVSPRPSRPARWRDEKRDLLLMTLNHEGQMIDIGGGVDARIYESARKSSMSDVTDFSGCRIPGGLRRGCAGDVAGTADPVQDPAERRA
jgi:hypothetical protein